jgi:hypothetical protein
MTNFVISAVTAIPHPTPLMPYRYLADTGSVVSAKDAALVMITVRIGDAARLARDPRTPRAEVPRRTIGLSSTSAKRIISEGQHRY